MSDRSPLFVSALELLAHSTELYIQKNQKKYKFVILHLANAIELILKDRLIDEGVSIFKNSSETISIWKSFETLEQKGINIKERPIIELLIDDRNTIQHKFGFPNAESVYYYLENVVDFFKRFLQDEYNVNLAEALQPHLGDEDLKFLGLAHDQFNELRKLAEISPESAVVQSFNFVIREFKEIIEPFDTFGLLNEKVFWRNPFFQKLLFMMSTEGYITEETRLGFNTLNSARNHAAHSATNDPKNPLWGEALEIAKNILQGLNKMKEDKVFDLSKYNNLLLGSNTNNRSDG